MREMNIVHELLTGKLGVLVMFVCMWMTITGIVFNFISEDPMAFVVMVLMGMVSVPIWLAVYQGRRKMKKVMEKKNNGV